MQSLDVDTEAVCLLCYTNAATRPACANPRDPASICRPCYDRAYAMDTRCPFCRESQTNQTHFVRHALPHRRRRCASFWCLMAATLVVYGLLWELCIPYPRKCAVSDVRRCPDCAATFHIPSARGRLDRRVGFGTLCSSNGCRDESLFIAVDETKRIYCHPYPVSWSRKVYVYVGRLGAGAVLYIASSWMACALGALSIVYIAHRVHHG